MFCGVIGPKSPHPLSLSLLHLLPFPTEEDRLTVHVLWSVLQQSMSHVVILHEVERNGLESSPAHGDDQRVFALQDLLVPAVLLQTNLHVARVRLGDRHSAENDHVARIEVIDEFTGDLGQFATHVHPGTIAFVEHALLLGHVLELRTIQLKGRGR